MPPLICIVSYRQARASYKQEERLSFHSLISKIGDFIIREESETLFSPTGISLPTRFSYKINEIFLLIVALGAFFFIILLIFGKDKLQMCQMAAGCNFLKKNLGNKGAYQWS